MSAAIDILQKVQEMFLRLGIKSVSMDDICRELGISKKTLYQIIPNKKTLIRQVIENYLSAEHDKIQKIKEKSQDPVHELVLIASHVMRMIRKVCPTTTYDLRKYYRENWRQLDQTRNRMIHNDIKRNLEHGIKEGIYREDIDPDLISILYTRMATYIVDEKILDVEQPGNLELYNQFIKYHIRGIATSRGILLLNKYESILNS